MCHNMTRIPPIQQKPYHSELCNRMSFPKYIIIRTYYLRHLRISPDFSPFHRRVVEVLLEAGFRCKVPERDLDLGGKDDFNLWASSESIQGPVYPPRLRVEDAEDSDSLDSFHITFAGPTVVPLHKWLAGYLPKQYKDFMALFLIYLWSQGIEFPTTALALMTARYRQVCCLIRPLHSILISC